MRLPVTLTAKGLIAKMIHLNFKRPDCSTTSYRCGRHSRARNSTMLQHHLVVAISNALIFVKYFTFMNAFSHSGMLPAW